MRISDWSSDVCSSDLLPGIGAGQEAAVADGAPGAQGTAEDKAAEATPTADDSTAIEAEKGEVTAAVNGENQIGRASCRERVCQYVSNSVFAVSLKKNNRCNKENKHT